MDNLDPPISPSDENAKNSQSAQNTKSSFSPSKVPAKPGVYVFRDRFSEVIYIGKASNLRKRMSHYFQPSKRRTADPKLRSLINSISFWDCYPVKNENESLVLESRLIKQYAPRYNVLMRDDKRFPLIKINLRERFPKLTVARVRKDDNCRYFGPFPQGGALRDTVRFLTRYFGIRACRVLDPSEKDHKHCMASIVKDCCRPCIGEISEADYRQKVDEMMRILEGNVKVLTDKLRLEMLDASEKLRFEKAAKLRDMINNIDEIFGAGNRSFRFATIPSQSGEDAVKDLHEVLKIPNAPKLIEGLDVSNISGTLAVASVVCFENGKPCRKNYRRFKIKNVRQIDDFAMMREVVTRHYGRKLRENRPGPDLLLVDGGKGQLSSAIQALKEINFPAFATLGLAKKNEEIFIPGRDAPLVIDRHRPALRLLQAIRDEAHRFAVNYHRELRGKRINESILDDIPGVGEARKMALLKEFSSIRELRAATPIEIAERVPKIGENFARQISDYLDKN